MVVTHDIIFLFLFYLEAIHPFFSLELSENNPASLKPYLLVLKVASLPCQLKNELSLYISQMKATASLFSFIIMFVLLCSLQLPHSFLPFLHISLLFLFFFNLHCPPQSSLSLLPYHPNSIMSHDILFSTEIRQILHFVVIVVVFVWWTFYILVLHRLFSDIVWYLDLS